MATVLTLTEWSESTFRRRIAEGSLIREFEGGSNGRAIVDFDSIRPHLCLPIEDDDIDLIGQADAGQAEAQNDLALLFLENNKPKQAHYWLDLASKQEYPDAMHWIGRCYLEGNGVVQDENMGIMWLAKAAARGHKISQGLMQTFRDRFVDRG